VGMLALFVVMRMVLVRQVATATGSTGGTSMLSAIRSFSRNARLFLTYSLFSELGSGIWTVLFNLYLSSG
jgi:hypothetical protein